MATRNVHFVDEPSPGTPVENVHADNLPGSSTVQNATTTTAGVVKQAEAIVDLSAAPTQEDFNGLLAKLRAAGILAS